MKKRICPYSGFPCLESSAGCISHYPETFHHPCLWLPLKQDKAHTQHFRNNHTVPQKLFPPQGIPRACSPPISRIKLILFGKASFTDPANKRLQSIKLQFLFCRGELSAFQKIGCFCQLALIQINNTKKYQKNIYFTLANVKKYISKLVLENNWFYPGDFSQQHSLVLLDCVTFVFICIGLPDSLATKHHNTLANLKHRLSRLEAGNSPPCYFCSS